MALVPLSSPLVAMLGKDQGPQWWAGPGQDLNKVLEQNRGLTLGASNRMLALSPFKSFCHVLACWLMYVVYVLMNSKMIQALIILLFCFDNKALFIMNFDVLHHGTFRPSTASCLSYQRISVTLLSFVALVLYQR